MVSGGVNIAGLLFFVVMCVGVPALFVWGWLRWLKIPRERGLVPQLSFAGFAGATASALLAISDVLYKLLTGADYYQPLMGYRWGYGLSFGACALALGALWRPSRLRWHALVCSLATLFFWYVMGVPD
jgi:hypothetical protein